MREQKTEGEIYFGFVFYYLSLRQNLRFCHLPRQREDYQMSEFRCQIADVRFQILNEKAILFYRLMSDICHLPSVLAHIRPLTDNRY